MRFAEAIDRYIADQRMYGRINSGGTEELYRLRLGQHCDDVRNRDPRKTGREDVKTTLARFEHPNTQRNVHAILASFYDWSMEEALRDTNPARQVRRAKAKPTSVYRMTREEVVALMDACRDYRERAVVHLGVLAGLRNAELRGLRIEHLARRGWVHVHPDIAKGGKERWVPVLSELEAVIAEAREHVEHGHVICQRRTVDPPANTRFAYRPEAGVSKRAICTIVKQAGERAGIAAHIHPHLLRHAYGDHVARHAGLRAAQALLGHASVETTQGTYVGRPTLDELAVSVHGFSYRGLSVPRPAGTPHG